MPLKQCKKGSQSGWQWGSGPCIIGKDAKKRVIKMAIKIEGPDKFKKIMQSEGSQWDTDLLEAAQAALSETRYNSPDKFLYAVEDWLATDAYISADDRKKIADEDFAWTEQRKFPINSQEHLDSAVKLIGRAPPDKQAAIKRRIVEIAHRKRLKLPDGWTKGGATYTMAEAEQDGGGHGQFLCKCGAVIKQCRCAGHVNQYQITDATCALCKGA